MGGACSTYWVEKRCINGVVEKPDRKNNLKDAGLFGMIILKWVFRKSDGGHGMDLSGSGWGNMAGSCECDSEPSASIICGEFLD